VGKGVDVDVGRRRGSGKHGKCMEVTTGESVGRADREN
jgi:hypothetical protein